MYASKVELTDATPEYERFLAEYAAKHASGAAALAYDAGRREYRQRRANGLTPDNARLAALHHTFSEHAHTAIEDEWYAEAVTNVPLTVKAICGGA